MADTKLYLGRPGNLTSLTTIRAPRGDASSNRQRRISAFELGVGGVSVDQMVGGARTYQIDYEMLTREDYAVLQAYAEGLEGPGPFVYLDPGQRNMLPANIAGATSVTFDVDGVRPVGGFDLIALADTYNRAVVASGWGSTERSQAWTTSPSANHSVNGTAAVQVLGSVNAMRDANIDLGNTNFDLTVDTTLDVGTPTGAGITRWLCGRYTDSNNYMAARLIVSSVGGNVQLAIYNRSGGTLSSALGSGAVTVGTGHTSGSVWRIRFTGSSTSFTASAWLRDSETEPSTPDVSVTDATIVSGTRIGLLSRLETSNTNTLPVTVTWDNLTAAPQAALTSDSTYSDAGPRTLALTFTTATTATIIPVWPSSVFRYGVPVVSGRALCMSAYVRGGGGDPIATYTMRLLWRGATGALLSATSGTPVASASGAWASVYATGTPPAGAVYADFDLQYTSGASAGTVAYFRRFQLEEGSTPGTWYPGTGVFPVRFGELPDAWPFLSPELRSRPSVVLLEDVS